MERVWMISFVDENGVRAAASVDAAMRICREYIENQTHDFTAGEITDMLRELEESMAASDEWFGVEDVLFVEMVEVEV